MTTDEQVIARVREALDVAPAHPSLRSRVMTSLPARREPSSPAPRWFAAVAVTVIVAVVIGAITVGRRGPHQAAQATMPGRIANCLLPVFMGPVAGNMEGFIDMSDGSFRAAPSSTTTRIP